MPVNSTRIEYINHDATGFSAEKVVPVGTTIGELFEREMSGKSTASYTILVNRDRVRRDYVLQEGDRVSITPTKVAGARVNDPNNPNKGCRRALTRVL